MLSISSLFAFGFLLIAEEYLLRNYYVQSTLIAGAEGLTALVFSLAAIPLINYAVPNFVNVS